MLLFVNCYMTNKIGKLKLQLFKSRFPKLKTHLQNRRLCGFLIQFSTSFPPDLLKTPPESDIAWFKPKL